MNDSSYLERAEIIREKGTNRARFFRGQIDKYSWVDLGSSYVMSDVLAAFLFAQLERWQDIQARRRSIWSRYHAELGAWCASNGVGQPTVPAHCEQAWHMYYILLPSLEKRQALISHLKSRGILAVFHYLPLNLSPYARETWSAGANCPVTVDISDRLLRLPFYNSLSQDDQGLVIEAITGFQL